MVTSQRRAATRARILDAAAAAFRAHGYAATGVDAVMAAAGLTHGGFYAHFASKRELLAATITHTTAGNQLFQRVAELHGEDFVTTAITAYLSRWHRDHPEEGCMIPTLGAELPRLDADMGAAMGRPVQGLCARLAAELPAPAETRQERAQALIALLVGGVVTARTLPDDDADSWLANCRRAAGRLAGLPKDLT